jgi:hypothetical protein
VAAEQVLIAAAELLVPAVVLLCLDHTQLLVVEAAQHGTVAIINPAVLAEVHVKATPHTEQEILQQ